MIHFTKAKATPPKPKKPKGGKKATLNKLKNFLYQAEPEAVEILVSNFNAQQNAVTYKELREAYLAGGITQKQFEKWQKDYSQLITVSLAPKWEAAAAAAAQEVKDKYPYFVYEPSVSAGMDFIKQHGAELVTNLAQEQRQALNAVIQHVSGYTNISPDEAARIIRPCIGLTKPQALANTRYREAVKQAYIKAHPHGKLETADKRAADAAARYAARQHRYRAQNIARTELAYAYNAGAYGATKDAQAQGYIGDCVKVWLTAYDERVCPICSAMDDEKRNMDEVFSNGKLLPPGHPSCRCAVAYEEIENTNLTPNPADGTIDAQGQQGAAAQPTPTPEPQGPNQPTIPQENQIGEPIDAETAETSSSDSEISAENQFKTQGYVGLSGAESDVFMETYHNETLLRNSKRVNDLSGEESGHIVNSAFNERVRTANETEADKVLMGQIDKAISENELPQDMTLFRGCSYKALPQIDTDGKTLEEIVEAINGKKGTTWSPGNYIQTSASSERNFFTDADVSLQIVADKGTPAYISNYKAESEIILGRDTKFEIIGADIVDGVKDIYGMDAGKRVTVMVRAVPSTSAAPSIPRMTPVKTESGYKVSDVLADTSVLPKNQQGVAIRSDGGMVEGLNLTGRRINIGGTEYYEVSGKLTEDAWAAAAQNAKKRGYSQKMDFLMYDQGAGQFRTGDVGLSLDGHRIMTLDQGSFEVYSDYVNKTQYGMGGFFRVRVPATGNIEKDSKAIQTVFDKAGLKSLTADPTEADELLLKKSRIAWQRDPKGMERVRAMNATAREQEIDKILRKAGIDEKRVQGMRLKEVFPGYSTYLDDAALAEYKKAGLTHIWAGVGDADSVVAITRSGGFTATNYRITSGMKKCGASASDDMMTGGSDSVFTRLGVNAPDRYSRSFLGGQYRVIIDPKEMTRTDWYAYKSDNYGNAKMSTAGTCASLPFDARATPVEFIKDMKNSYRSSNEIMFRHGISSDSFVGISCESDSMRKTLIDKFKASGVTEIRGVPVEDFIQTTQHIKQDSQRGIEGLDFYDPDKPAF